MTSPQGSAPSLDRYLDTLRLEEWGRVSGHGRFAAVNFPNGSVAIVSNDEGLAVSVWRGLQEVARD